MHAHLSLSLSLSLYIYIYMSMHTYTETRRGLRPHLRGLARGAVLARLPAAPTGGPPYGGGLNKT